MRRKIIIAVAPTGGWGSGRNNPVTPQAIAAEVLESARAGATIAHMHSRDLDGALTSDITFFQETVDRIREKSNIIIEASTGGLSELTAMERVAPVGCAGVDMGSLNIGSLNFGDDVYQNGVPDVRIWISSMRRYDVKPSLEVFDTGHLETGIALIEDELVTIPANFNFIFGVKWGMPFNSVLLSYLVERLPDTCRWGATFIGSTDFDQHVEAALAGAEVIRSGFEDTQVNAGTTATRNAEIIAALAKNLEKSGFDIADPSEARSQLLD